MESYESCENQKAKGDGNNVKEEKTKTETYKQNSASKLSENQSDAGNISNGPINKYLKSDNTTQEMPTLEYSPSTSKANGSQPSLSNKNSKQEPPSPSNENDTAGKSCSLHYCHCDGDKTSPSTSADRAADPSPRPNIPNRESRKRPSTLRLNIVTNDDEDSSSDTGNDDYSLGSEDGCMYTYRGGEHLADLPSSFFSLDMGLPAEQQMLMNYLQRPEAAPQPPQQRSRPASPEMDFLEMDFDPGPSNEADTGDEASPDADIEEIDELAIENEFGERSLTPEANMQRSMSWGALPPAVMYRANVKANVAVPSTSGTRPKTEEPQPSTSSNTCTAQVQTSGAYITHVNFRGEHLRVRRTMAHGAVYATVNHHLTSGNLISPQETHSQDEEPPACGSPARAQAPETAACYHAAMAQRLADAAPDAARTAEERASSPEPERRMVWAEREAAARQVTQLGASACGATAVVNAFVALGVPVSVERVTAAVGTQLRHNHAPLPRYLLSRCVAGCTGAQLAAGLQRASEGLVSARFFATWPERAVALAHWLADWIALGAVPIVTQNLQVSPADSGDVPDAWHHQMVFGVSPRGVFLCNPIECVPATALWARLAAPSTLLVRTGDVLARYTPGMDLSPLVACPDVRWQTYNVLGQVVNVIREWRAANCVAAAVRTRHVRIPAAYRAGVTVAALTGSDAHRRLTLAADLPLVAGHRE